MENVKNTLFKQVVCHANTNPSSKCFTWTKIIHSTISFISSLSLFGHIPLLDLPSFFSVGKRSIQSLMKDKPPVLQMENWVKSVKNLYI